jgi:hypothetical protein
MLHPYPSVEPPSINSSRIPIDFDVARSTSSRTAAARTGWREIDDASRPGLETLGAGEIRPGDCRGSVNLKSVLKQQVFKYIHNALLCHQESIDGPARLKLGKTV